MNTTNKEQEERQKEKQKATQVYQELTQSELTLFESFVNVAFVLFVNRYPVQDTKKENEKCL